MKKIAIIAIDPSSKKLACVYSLLGQEKSVKFETIQLPKLKPEACHIAYEWIQDLILKVEGVPAKHMFVFIELPILGVGGFGSTLPQAQINGALLAGAYAMGVNVISVNNMTCKKQVIGKGNSNKDDIQRWVRTSWAGLYKKFGTYNKKKDIIIYDQDLCDSAMIYMYGKKVVELRERITTSKSLGDVSSKRDSKVNSKVKEMN